MPTDPAVAPMSSVEQPEPPQRPFDIDARQRVAYGWCVSIDDNKALARVWFDEVMNRRDLGAIDRTYADDYRYSGPSGTTARGREDARRIAERLIEAMPDRVSIVEGQIAEGDTVVTRWVSRGTPVGSLLGREPDGRAVSVHGITISRIANGRIAEDWEIISVTSD